MKTQLISPTHVSRARLKLTLENEIYNSNYFVPMQHRKHIIIEHSSKKLEGSREKVKPCNTRLLRATQDGAIVPFCDGERKK